MKRLYLMLLLFALIGIASAQQRTVSGKVTNVAGEPLAGVAVIVVEDQTNGTITGMDGSYSLRVGAASKQLEFSFIGMQSKVLAISGSVLNVVMEEAAELVDEVLVVAYGTTTKSSFTGSAGIVSDKELENIQTSDLAKTLQGSVAGVSVETGSGQPGKEAKMRIRGIGSINASKDPLIIVDGAPFNGDLNSINSMDVASMSVLKDAASAALYGARGANGVVMITTKKGIKGKTAVTFSSRLGKNYRGVSEYDIMTSPAEYYETFWEALRNQAVYADNKTQEEAAVYASSTLYEELGYNIYNVENDQIVLGNGRLNPDAELKYKESNWGDWEGFLYKPQLRQQYDLSVSKGGESNRVYFSLGYLDDKGYSENSGFSRISSRISYDTKLYDWLDFNTSAQISKTVSNWTQTGTAYTNTFQWTRRIAPIYPVYRRDGDGKIILDHAKKNMYDFGEVQQGVNGARAYGSFSNPVATQNEDMDERTTYYFSESSNVIIKLPYNLTLSGNLAFDGEWWSRGIYVTPLGGSGATYNGLLRRYEERTININANQVLKWVKEVDDWSIDAMLGHESFSMDFRYSYGEKSNFLDPDNTEFSNAAKIGGLLSHTEEYRVEGYFGQLKGDYLDRYFFSTSLRRDASSVFAPGRRWGTFWSVGMSWRVSEEGFMSDFKFMDNLKLKGSYGLQGNDFLYLPDLTSSTRPKLRRSYSPYKTMYSVASDGENLELSPKYMGNEDVTWEKNYNLNLGLEFSIFNGTLSGEFNYFTRKTKDLLFNLPVSDVTGFTSMPTNIGEMENVGFEISLNSAIIKRQDFVWKVNVNGYTFDNKILSLPEEFKETGIISRSGNQRMIEGGSIYDFYLVKYAGVDKETGNALFWLKDDKGKFVKMSGEDYSTAGNKQVVGSSIADFIGGFGTSLEYKGLDFSVQFAYQLGGQVLDDTYGILMHVGTAGNNWHKDIENRWTETNKDSEIPRLEFNNQKLTESSDRFLTDASYLAFNNITLGYTLPQSIVRRVGLNKLRVYLVGDGVALWSKRKGMDPRLSSAGLLTDSEYSAIRTYSLGFSLSF